MVVILCLSFISYIGWVVGKDGGGYPYGAFIVKTCRTAYRVSLPIAKGTELYIALLWTVPSLLTPDVPLPLLSFIMTP